VTVALGHHPLADLVGADIAVPLVQGGQARYVNLDYAASTPSLVQVAARVAEVLPWYASVHRGSGYLSLVSTSLYESARATVQRFVGARRDDVVIFTRNTTDGLNLLVRAVPAGGEVVYLDIEHHADLLPWQRHPNRCFPSAPTLAETVERLARDLEERPAALLAVTGASNVTGEVVPLSPIVKMAHERGARVAVDAAQLTPHRIIDISGQGVDYLAFSGHKCYAPFGAGVLVGRRDWLDEAPAYLAGGGAVESVAVDKTNWALSPERHEGGRRTSSGPSLWPRQPSSSPACSKAVPSKLMNRRCGGACGRAWSPSAASACCGSGRTVPTPSALWPSRSRAMRPAS